MSRKQQPTFDINEAWAAVAYADRINEQQYVNRETYFESGSTQKELSKVLAMNALLTPGLITDEDRAFAKDMISHFSGLLFKKIGTGVHGFLATVTSIIGMKQVGTFEIACMASLPKTYRADINREKRFEGQTILARTSQYISQVGSKVNTQVKVIESIYSKNYNIFIYTCTDSKNVFKFTSAHNVDRFPLDTDITIRGTVKRHDVNNKTGAKETWLTRVKLA